MFVVLYFYYGTMLDKCSFRCSIYRMFVHKSVFSESNAAPAQQQRSLPTVLQRGNRSRPAHKRNPTTQLQNYSKGAQVPAKCIMT